MQVDINNVQPGAILGADIDEGHVVLLRRGAYLSSTSLHLLKRHGITSVEIERDGAGDHSGKTESLPENAVNDASFLAEWLLLESLFEPLKPLDEQMTLLLRSLLRHLEERYSE